MVFLHVLKFKAVKHQHLILRVPSAVFAARLLQVLEPKTQTAPVLT